MEIEERKKIAEAVNLCENKMHSFFKYLDKTLPQSLSRKLSQHILANTFFAGGVFREVLIGGSPNDIDVWFKDTDSMIEFKHLVYSHKSDIFSATTPNESFNWKSKGPALSFVTIHCGTPEQIINRFDFSFNQHYYDMGKFKLCIDRDTFNKIGTVNPQARDKEQTLFRAFRFMNEGWKIDEPTLKALVLGLAKNPNDFKDADSSGGSITKRMLPLTSKEYREQDYLGTKVETNVTVSGTTFGVLRNNMTTGDPAWIQPGWTNQAPITAQQLRRAMITQPDTAQMRRTLDEILEEAGL